MREDLTIKNFELLKKKGQPLAYTKKIGNHLIVFGTRFLEQKMLKELFPEFQFYFLKQVHGNRVVPARSLSPTADGHFTSQKNQALCLRTADCLPVFFIKETKVFALHIGWRGIANGILRKGLELSIPPPSPLSLTLTPQASPLPLLPLPPPLEKGGDGGGCIVIGPHILKESFLVKKDTAGKLAQSAPQARQFVKKKAHSHFQVCLLSILKDQALSSGKLKKFLVLKINTFSSNLFYSFRRSAEKNKGQISFIVKTK